MASGGPVSAVIGDGDDKFALAATREIVALRIPGRGRRERRAGAVAAGTVPG
jgi:hypothetical protein